MPDFSGPVQPVVVSRALLLLLAAPVATAVVHFVKSTNEHSADAAAVTRQARWNRQGALVTALFAVAALAALFAQPATDRFFLQHVVRWLRAGELDANLDLACDPLAALLLLGAAGLAAAGAASTTVSAAAILAAVALVVLSGDLACASLGLLLLAALASPLLRRARSIAFAATFVMLVATALLFWGTGGEWHPDGYGSDFRARLAAVTVGAPIDSATTAPRGQGFLTLTAYPGSPIFLDDSRSPLEKNGNHLYTPFARLPLPAGVHSVRVHPGMGEDDQLVAQESMGDGRELALVPIGATLSPRALADELALVDSTGVTSWRDAYLARRLFASLRVAPVTAWLFVLVALLQGAAATAAALAARRRGGMARDDAKLAALVGASGAAVLLRLRAPLSLAVPAGVILGAVVVAAALAAVPLVLARRGGATGGKGNAGAASDEAADADRSWFALLAGRVVQIPALALGRLGSSAPSTVTRARASTVDAAFAAFVLLFIFALVLAR